MNKQENVIEINATPVGNDEMAEYVTGIADGRTTARVLRAALADSATRAALWSMMTRNEDAQRAAQTAEPTDAAQAENLKARLRAAAITVARETPLMAAPSTEPEKPPLAVRLWERVLQTGQALLTLPCLAPATAASAPTQSPLHKQTIQTGDGVHIEFQQLPGDPPYRLRAIVDASQLHSKSGTSMVESAPYNVAYLTLEEGDSASATPPARHLLIVPLNAQTRGYADFVIGGPGPSGIPIPLSTCRLVSATLSHTASMTTEE